MNLKFSLPLFLLAALSGCSMMQPKKEDSKVKVKVAKGEMVVKVIETGTLQAAKVVEVKSRVSGRVKNLNVDEGMTVSAGQIIAEIDPQETQLQVDQNSAQVRGAMAGADRQNVEIAQRRITVQNSLDKARSNLRQVQMELKVQPDLTRSSVTSAQASLKSAKYNLDQLVNVSQPNAKLGSQIAVRDSQNNFEIATKEYNRLKHLLELGYVSERDVESAHLQLQLAETKLKNAQETNSRLEMSQKIERDEVAEKVRQAQSALDQAQANTIQDSVKREQYLRAVRDVSDAEAQLRDISALQAGRRQQLAQIEQLRSVLSDGQRQLRETRIIAPISGLVTVKSVQVGELVASLNSFSAGTTIVQLEDRSSLIVKLNINEIDVAKLQIGTNADISVDAFPTETFKGKVTKIAPASMTSASAQAVSSDTVVKYKVEITLEGVSPKLKSGMSAKCTMKVVDKKGVLKVPSEYLGLDEDGNYLILAPKNPKDKNDKGTKVKVTVGARSSSEVEILSGVQEGLELVKPEYKGPKRKGMISVNDE